jgi:hypothetical protein
MLDHFATRQQDRSEVTLDRMWEVLAAEGNAFSRGEVVAVFRSLQSLGAGAFVIGRRRHPSRFQRRVNLIELAKAARGDSESLPSPPVSAVQPLATVKSDVIAHRYVLRPDFTLTIHLPSDLTSAEANRFGEFVKTLPFN